MNNKHLQLNVVQKFIAYLVVLSILPLLTVSAISTRVAQSVLQEEASKYSAELVMNQRDYLVSQLDQVESLLANLSGVEEIRTVLEDKNQADNTYTYLATQAHIGYILSGYYNLKGLVSIEIFTPDGTHYHVGDTLDVSNIQQTVRDRIFDETLAYENSVYWTGIENNVNVSSKHKQVLTAAKIVYNVNRETLKQDPMALLLVNYSIDYLYDYFNSIDLGDGAYLLVTDAKNRLIYHPDKSLLGTTLDASLAETVRTLPHVRAEQMSDARISVNDQEMVISHAHLEENDWLVMSFIPIETLTAKTAAITRTTVIALLVCLGFVAIFAFIYTHKVVTPIRQVTSHFQQLQAGTLNMQVRLPVHGNDEIGDLTKWFNSFMNSLAARESSENALRESEARNRALLKAIPDLMFVLNKDGIYLDYHASSPEKLVTSPDQFMGKSMYDILPPNLARSYNTLFTMALETGETQLHEYALEIDDETHHFEARIAPYSNGRILTIVRDITERVNSEIALRQTQKLESLGVLAGGIAHDFNNLLGVIMAQSSLAAHRLDLNLDAQESIEKVMTATSHAAELTKQMLAYSGRGKFEVKLLNLNSLIVDNLHMFEVAIPKKVVLKSELREGLPQIEADVSQMQQVIMNLIINGAEAINGRAGTVEIRTSVEELDGDNDILYPGINKRLPAGEYVVLQVEDDGCGMDCETAAKIFEPFFTTKFTGRGLGLAAVLGIVKGHHGGLSVQSEKGTGTCFTIYLPVSDMQPVREKEAPQFKQNGHKEAATILAIDDESAVREAIVDIFSLDGLKVMTAANGKDGLEIYKNHSKDIDLIILDLSMPGLNGEETYTELQKIKVDAPVLISSGYSQAEISERFANKGIRGFLQKPYDLTSLLQTVQENL